MNDEVVKSGSYRKHKSTPLPQSVVGVLLLISCSCEVEDAANWSNTISRFNQLHQTVQFKDVNIFQARTNLLNKWG